MESGWGPTKTELFSRLTGVMNELADLEPALVGLDASELLIGNDNQESIHTRMKVDDEGIAYLIAYNYSDQPAIVTFSFNSAVPTTQVSVHGESRFIAAEGNSFADAFAPYEAHVYAVGNLAPQANFDTYNVLESSSLTTASPGVLENDIDAIDLLTAELVEEPSHGNVSLNVDGAFLYTPVSGFTGTDSFSYRAFDGHSYSNPATVTLVVHPEPEPTGVVVNGHFEHVDADGIPIGWRFGSADRWLGVSNEFYDGVSSLRLCDADQADWTPAVSQAVFLEPGIHTLRGWIKGQELENGGVRFSLWHGTSQVASTQIISGTTDWTLSSIESIPITEAGQYTVRIDAYNKPSGTALIDGVTLEVNNHFVGEDDLLTYNIPFENMSDANAPATLITVTDTLDEDLDLSTFELAEIGFGDQSITVPEGLNNYETTVDLTIDNEFVSGAEVRVEIEAVLDVGTRELTLTIIGLDPATGLLPENTMAGILYPNDDTGRGEGYISYKVKPKDGLPTGSEITNKASIIFDWNDPIETPLVLYTIDAAGPTSQVDPWAPGEIPEYLSPIPVSWSGQDNVGGSGIATYDIYYRIDSGDYVLWLDDTADTSATLTWQQGTHTYDFYSIATDNVGHQELTPLTPDASVTLTIAAIPGDASIDGVVNQADAAIVSANWLMQTGANWADGDFNNDGRVNEIDATLMAANWQRTVSPPATSALVAAEPSPVSYDLDNSGKVDLGDLALFASVYREKPGITTESPYAYAADFDCSGTVDLGDLALFAANYRLDQPDAPIVSSAAQKTALTMTAAPAILPGDTNLDGTVNGADAEILATNWQKQSGTTWSDGDFNGDGKVTDKDVAIIAQHWMMTMEDQDNNDDTRDSVFAEVGSGDDKYGLFDG